jgi:hypothetical protein
MAEVKLIHKVAVYILGAILIVVLGLVFMFFAFCCVLSPALLCLIPFAVCFFLGGSMAKMDKSLTVTHVLVMVGSLLIGAVIAILVSGWLAPITFVPAVVAAVCACLFCCQQRCLLPCHITSASEEVEAEAQQAQRDAEAAQTEGAPKTSEAGEADEAAAPDPPNDIETGMAPGNAHFDADVEGGSEPPPSEVSGDDY